MQHISSLPATTFPPPVTPKSGDSLGIILHLPPPFTLNTEARSINMGRKKCTFSSPFSLPSFTSLDETNLLFLSSFSQVIISCSPHWEPLGSSF